MGVAARYAEQTTRDRMVMGDLAKAITALVDGLPQWLQLTVLIGAPVLLAVIGSSWVTQLVVGRHENRARLSERRFADTSAAAKALRKYRSAVLTSANEGVPDADEAHARDAQLASLGSDVLVTCTMVRAGALLEETERYLGVAELFAAQDEFTGTEEELSAFRSLIASIASARSKA